jgi:hypothetical protein
VMSPPATALLMAVKLPVVAVPGYCI